MLLFCCVTSAGRLPGKMPAGRLAATGAARREVSSPCWFAFAVTQTDHVSCVLSSFQCCSTLLVNAFKLCCFLYSVSPFFFTHMPVFLSKLSFPCVWALGALPLVGTPPAACVSRRILSPAAGAEAWLAARAEARSIPRNPQIPLESSSPANGDGGAREPRACVPSAAQTGRTERQRRTDGDIISVTRLWKNIFPLRA